MYQILIIDDEKEIVDLIEIYLKNEGYQVYKAYQGEAGIEILKNNTIHLVVLDIMMPKIDGLEVCRRIRAFSNIPVIMLSAKSRDMDKILGLGIGADDYLSKPFNPMELIARIKSQLRRCYQIGNSVQAAANDTTIEICGLTINKKSHSVSLKGSPIDLTPTEYEILLLLAGNPKTVFSAEDIFLKIWKEKYYDSNNTVMVHIWRLREKIEANPKEPVIIKTVWGVGYIIEG
jgi:DNA-binding response OmpR family regulator